MHVIDEQIQALDDLVKEVHSSIADIEQASIIMINCLENHGKILIAGNGGSSSDAMHFAAELVGNFINKKRRALPTIALSSNQSTLTSISNDLGFENVFKRQLEALVSENDVFIGISTSGKSPNILNALEFAKENGLKTIGLCGRNVNEMKKLTDVLLSVKSVCTPRIQECHIFIIHILCSLIEDHFLKEKQS